MTPARKWTDDKLAVMREFAEAGKTAAEYCAANGEKVENIRAIARNNGIKFVHAPTHPLNDWTPARVEKLSRLWMEGFSAAQVAKELGGVTRSGVIGKVHRLGLSGRERPSHPSRPIAIAGQPRTTPRKAVPRPIKPKSIPPTSAFISTGEKAPPVFAKPDTVFNANPKRLEDIGPRECRWICDSGLMCANRCEDDGAWCPAHRKVVFWKPPGRVMTANELARSLRRYT